MTQKIQQVNKYLKRNYVPRTIVGTFLAFCLLAALQYPARSLYYGQFSGEWFLNVESAAVTYTDDNGKTSTNVPQDKVGDIEIIRKPRTRVTGYNVIRTFYLKANDLPVLQRELPEPVEYEQNIDRTKVPLKPGQRPNDPGIYYFCQTISFKAEGFDKHATFCTTSYRIIPPTGK